MRPARAATIAALLSTPFALASCTVRTPPSSGAPSRTGIAYAEAFPPAELVVHPLTRMTTDPDTGERRIEAHFELLDRYGHTVKSLGNVALELRVVELGTAGAAGGPRQLRRWTADLTTPDANARPFDRVTRTYRLTLIDLPPNLPAADTLTLNVRYTTASGIRLSAERPLGRIR